MPSAAAPFNIQPWMWNTLQNLSQKGDLYNVPPEVIAAELRAQNGIPGGGVSYPVQPNGSGYGFLGLGANTYDTPSGPQQVSSALLTGNSGQGFATLSQIAAGRIATLSTGGNLQQGIATYDAWNPSDSPAQEAGQSGSTLNLLQSAGYTVPTSGWKPSSGSPGQQLAQSSGAQGSTSSGVGPISPTNPNGLLNPSSLLGGSSSSGSSSSSSSGSVLGNCSGCLVKIPVVGGCGFSQCNAKALVGGLLAAGGALGMVVGVLIMVKTSVGLGALGRVARGAGSSSAAPTVASGLAEPAAEPADEAIPPVPEPTAVPVAAAVPDEDYDIDAELAAYYQGVQDGIDTPRRSPKQVGVMIPADAGGEDDF